ncbi:hypothetical protein BHE74_00041245 [Ensete ventricosum]|nr:hypothetical protein GW17_00042570 [Ensete ventricosum]RWW52352.1 hypothetical protein BHE74_00041245 [Ensete ventricosum]RZS09164.1 hypothetical protein BHM03_00040222 [Ensete ventricosum]
MDRTRFPCRHREEKDVSVGSSPRLVLTWQEPLICSRDKVALSMANAIHPTAANGLACFIHIHDDDDDDDMMVVVVVGQELKVCRST